jgi:pyruvate/2-oxoglutarate dehydrogenase complex dihydrolipoamide acyltransferase (E2) component
VGRHPVTAPGRAGYSVRPMVRERRPVLDRLAGASRRFQVHALVELDVGEARARLAGAEPRVSWTGFVVATLGRAVARHPEVNARRVGNRILMFDRVDIGATVEREHEGRRVLDITVVRDADRKTCAAVTAELHEAKGARTALARPTRFTGVVVRLPGPLRRAAIRAAGRSVPLAAGFGPAVGVTSMGMFSRAWGWAVPLAPLTVIATVGGVVDRPAVVDGAVGVRPMLPLTLSFDHALIDGAPAARFTETLRELFETAAVLPPPADR